MQWESGIARPSTDVKVRNVGTRECKENASNKQSILRVFQTAELVKSALRWVLRQLRSLSEEKTSSTSLKENN